MAQSALLVVDVQNDFCPGGALAVPDGDAVVPVLNDYIARELHRKGAWNDPAWIADHLLGLLAGTWVPETAVVRVPDIAR